MAFIETKTLFGMNTMEIGSVTVYTMKLVFKSLEGYKIPEGVRVWPAKKGIMTMFETTDPMLAHKVNQEMGAIAKDIAVRKLSKKYDWVSQENYNDVAVTKEEIVGADHPN